MLLLEQLIGHARVDAALTRLLKHHAGRYAAAADVRRAFVETVGRRVERFFDDYFDGITPIPEEVERYGA